MGIIIVGSESIIMYETLKLYYIYTYNIIIDWQQIIGKIQFILYMCT